MVLRTNPFELELSHGSGRQQEVGGNLSVATSWCVAPRFEPRARVVPADAAERQPRGAARRGARARAGLKKRAKRAPGMPPSRGRAEARAGRGSPRERRPALPLAASGRVGRWPARKPAPARPISSPPPDARPCVSGAALEQGIQEYNGGAVLGMAGKNCVAVACDMRYGAQMQTMAIDKNKVFKMHDR